MYRILFALCLFASCTKPSEKLISQAENYLKENLKDPSSYQRMEMSIVDTNMLRQDLTYKVKLATLQVEEYDLKNKREARNAVLYDRPVDSLEINTNNMLKGAKATTLQDYQYRLNSLKGDSIYNIRIHFKYRAKNSMGALDIQENNVNYYPSQKTFEMD